MIHSPLFTKAASLSLGPSGNDIAWRLLQELLSWYPLVLLDLSLQRSEWPSMQTITLRKILTGHYVWWNLKFVQHWNFSDICDLPSNRMSGCDTDLRLGWMLYRAYFRLAPNQWETSLQCNAVSHWLGANPESTLIEYWCSSLRKCRHGNMMLGKALIDTVPGHFLKLMMKWIMHASCKHALMCQKLSGICPMFLRRRNSLAQCASEYRDWLLEGLTLVWQVEWYTWMQAETTTERDSREMFAIFVKLVFHYLSTICCYVTT